MTLRPGGLMRCCIESLNLHVAATPDSPVGTVVPCRWCQSSVVLADDGTWEWSRLKEVRDAHEDL